MTVSSRCVASAASADIRTSPPAPPSLTQEVTALAAHTASSHCACFPPASTPQYAPSLLGRRLRANHMRACRITKGTSHHIHESQQQQQPGRHFLHVTHAPNNGPALQRLLRAKTHAHDTTAAPRSSLHLLLCLLQQQPVQPRVAVVKVATVVVGYAACSSKGGGDTDKLSSASATPEA